jgi:hypothetical protein
MTSQHFFLIVALICLILYIISLFVYREGFDPSPSPSDSPSPTSDGTPAPTITCPPANNFWWETQPPKQIVSLITGVSFPVIAKTPSQAIRSDYQIPFINSGDSSSSGCIGIDDANGTYTTKVCNNNDISQLWLIKPIKNEADLKSIILQGKNRYSMLRDENDTSITLPPGVKYGFFMIVSKSDNGVFALASNGGNLTVQTVGNFTAQFWDLSKDPGVAGIAVYDTNDLTRLSTNYINPQNQIDQRKIGLNPLMPLNAQAGAIYETTGKVQQQQLQQQHQNRPTSINGKEINLNLNLTGELLSSLFNGSTNPTQAGGAAVVTTAGTEGFNKQACPACPSILTDYISKNNIPCYGCNL